MLESRRIGSAPSRRPVCLLYYIPTAEHMCMIKLMETTQLKEKQREKVFLFPCSQLALGFLDCCYHSALCPFTI